MPEFDAYDEEATSVLSQPSSDVSKKGAGVTNMTLSFLEQQGPLKSFISKFVKRPQDVDDIAQDTFIRAIRAEKRNDIEFPRAYLYRIARNLSFEFLSKKHVKLTNYIEDCALDDICVPVADVEKTIAVNERMVRVKEAIADLPPQCQRVFIMHKVYGFKYREIASQLGISMSTVEKHIISGLRKCRHSVLAKEKSDGVVSLYGEPRKALGTTAGQAE